MTDSPEEEDALEADAKAYHADDLVKRLRREEEYPGGMLDEAADRIEHLQKLLEMRDVFIVKHGLWHEFVDSLELKND